MPLTRRSFLASTSAATLLAWCRRSPLSAQTAASASTAFEDVRGAVRIFTGRGGTIGVRATKDLLVIVDTQYADTARVLADAVMPRHTGQLRVFLTHHHGDHTGGNRVFKDLGATIVGHAQVPVLQQRAAAEAPPGTPPPVLPDETFATEHVFGRGTDTVRLTHHGPAHTGGDSVVHFEHEHVVHMGDLVFNRRHPFIDRPGGASIQNWIVTLEHVARTYGPNAKFIFGHAGEGFPVVGVADDLLAMRDYLSALLEAARAAVARGVPRETFVTSRLPERFAIYDPRTPPAQPNPRFGLAANLGVAYDEVAAAK